MPTSFITRFLEGVERVMVPLHGILNIPSEPRYPIQLYVSQRLSSHRQREKARLRRRIIERATGGLNPTDPNRKGETLPIPLPRNLYSICILLYSFPCKRPNNLQLPFQMPSPPPLPGPFLLGLFCPQPRDNSHFSTSPIYFREHSFKGVDSYRECKRRFKFTFRSFF